MPALSVSAMSRVWRWTVVALNRDAFVAETEIEPAVNLEAHRADSALDEIELDLDLPENSRIPPNGGLGRGSGSARRPSGSRSAVRMASHDRVPGPLHERPPVQRLPDRHPPARNGSPEPSRPGPRFFAHSRRDATRPRQPLVAPPWRAREPGRVSSLMSAGRRRARSGAGEVARVGPWVQLAIFGEHGL